MNLLPDETVEIKLNYDLTSIPDAELTMVDSTVSRATLDLTVEVKDQARLTLKCGERILCKHTHAHLSAQEVDGEPASGPSA